MQKFKEIVNRLQITAEEKNDIILKFKLMINARNEEKCIFLKESLVSIKEIKEFFDTSMKNRISTSTKAYTKDVWSLGYLTSSISEINNSNIKQLMGNRALTLREMRDVITHADKRRTHNRMFIKKRKQRKAYGSDVLKFMKNCNVDKRIAEALNGSYQKSIKVKVLSINDFWQVTEESGDSFYVQNAQNWTCSCGKLSSSGLPCSHLMRILNDKGILMETLPNIIAPRWIISHEKLELSLIEKSDELIDVEFDTYEHSTTIKERYLDLRAKSQTIAELACKNEANFKDVMEAYETIGKKLLGMVVDAHGIRSGRPRKSRLKHK